MLRDELRPLRMHLELLKPELLQNEAGISTTLVVFGSTQIRDRQAAEKNLADKELELAADPANALLLKQVEIAKRIRDKSHYYDMSQELGRLVTEASKNGKGCHAVIITGSGPGIMEAANRGASEAGDVSIGLNISLPREQVPNAFITPEFCFRFVCY